MRDSLGWGVGEEEETLAMSACCSDEGVTSIEELQ